eukprot:CAMPEP_0119061626 /NCGR_PEP_ID=MMETSP1178-20130426/5405_1 /TAXON_ID=33656 /ORGANISM="unid sp, Strain CCMP2000" /LENGTH=164 /DNA_ID=CAMNT_0007042855 /DNA_START=46 /DNA_END=540 /DNA_ORIENTATION=+
MIFLNHGWTPPNAGNDTVTSTQLLSSSINMHRVPERLLSLLKVSPYPVTFLACAFVAATPSAALFLTATAPWRADAQPGMLSMASFITKSAYSVLRADALPNFTRALSELVRASASAALWRVTIAAFSVASCACSSVSFAPASTFVCAPSMPMIADWFSAAFCC